MLTGKSKKNKKNYRGSTVLKKEQEILLHSGFAQKGILFPQGREKERGVRSKDGLVSAITYRVVDLIKTATLQGLSPAPYEKKTFDRNL